MLIAQAGAAGSAAILRRRLPRSGTPGVVSAVSSATGDAPELGEDVWIVGLEPVAKAPPQELRGRRPRPALEDEVLAVEEIRRVAPVAGDPRLESGESRERRVGPFPSVAHEVMRAPRARALGKRAHRRGRPASKIEVAVLTSGRRGTPGKRSLSSRRISVGSPMELHFRGQPKATPSGEGPRLGQAHVDRPVLHALQREKIEEATVEPSSILARPSGRVTAFLVVTPVPVIRSPQLPASVAAIVHEGEELAIGHGVRIDVEGRHEDLKRSGSRCPRRTRRPVASPPAWPSPRPPARWRGADPDPS